ncbi:hypothetical protein [Aeoliella sp.]|uniref:hypothetical protein n=1 Tax=Aeoliella sp. TaxID=2795800 RepID=UPI003CCC1A75
MSREPEKKAPNTPPKTAPSRAIQEILRKQRAGADLTVRERRAIERFERQQQAIYGPFYARNYPKVELVERLDTHRRVLIDQSKRFGLGYHSSRKTVDLLAMLAAWHRWATRHWKALVQVFDSRDADNQSDENDTLEFWQRELTKEKALKERDGRLDRTGESVSRESVHAMLQEFYVEPYLSRLDQLAKREEPISPEEIASWHRQDLAAFQQAMQALVDDPSERRERLGRSTTVASDDGGRCG